MIFSISTLLIGTLLLLVQVLAALPWVLTAFAPRAMLVRGILPTLRATLATSAGRQTSAIVGGAFVLFSLLLPALFFFVTRDKDALDRWGRLYAAVLQLQLTIDLFVLLFPLLLLVWPKGGAV